MNRRRMLKPVRKGTHEVERTCDRDGTVWYVGQAAINDEAAVRAASASILGNALGPTLTTRGSVTRNARIDRSIAAQARAAHSTACPSCGSTSFTEAIVPKATA